MPTVSINLEPDEPVLDGRHLNLVITKWLDYCSLRLPKASITAYKGKIKFFIKWWNIVGPSQQWHLRKDDLLLFSQYLDGLKNERNGKQLEYNTRREVLGRLRAALKWAYDNNYTAPLNCALWVPTEPDGTARLHLPVSIEHLCRMFVAAGQMEFRCDALGEIQMRIRNRALLAVFIGTGARLSEVANIAVEDVNFHPDSSGTILIRHAKKVRNRKIHQRLICFDKYTGHYLRVWLLTIRKTKGPLWMAATGETLTHQGIYKAIRNISKFAKVKIKGAHDFRRTFITYWADKRPGEGQYHLLQLQVGHTPQGVTHQLYDLRTIESVRKAFISPMNEVAHLVG